MGGAVHVTLSSTMSPFSRCYSLLGLTALFVPTYTNLSSLFDHAGGYMSELKLSQPLVLCIFCVFVQLFWRNKILGGGMNQSQSSYQTFTDINNLMGGYTLFGICAGKEADPSVIRV